MSKALYSTDYESGIGNWVTVNGGSTLSNDAVVFRAGAKSLKVITDGTIASQGAFVNNAAANLNLTEGTVIDYAAWVRPPSGSKVTLYKRMNFVGGATLTAQSDISPTGDGSTWSLIRGGLTVPSGKILAGVAIGIRTFVQEAITFYVDDAGIEIRTDGIARPSAYSPAADGYAYVHGQGLNENEAIRLRDRMLATNGR